MAAYITRRSAICVAAAGASLAFGKARAEDMAGRVVYPVALPTYQSQFVAHGRGFFKEAGPWIGVGNVDTMLGALKSKQIDVLVSTPSMERDSDQHGWGKLLFDGSSAENWNKTIGGNVPVTAHFALLSNIQKDPAKIQAFTTALWRAT